MNTIPNNSLVKEVIERKIIKYFEHKDKNYSATYQTWRVAAKIVIRIYYTYKYFY